MDTPSYLSSGRPVMTGQAAGGTSHPRTCACVCADPGMKSVPGFILMLTPGEDA